jgi:hypothetical protein
MHWKKELAVAQLVKLELHAADAEELWPFFPPNSPASDEQIQAVEHQLGVEVDPSLADFLRTANGWPAFYQCVDLFRCEDFGAGPRWARASELLETVDHRSFGEGAYPVAVSAEDIDLFVLIPYVGKVVWFAGGVIDEFPSFEEFFLAMVDYNRARALKLRDGVRR